MAPNRTFIQICGPPQSGKTELIQRLLEANESHRIGVVRTESAESDAPAYREIRDDRAELRRYDASGAATSAVVRHNPERESAKGIWETDVVGFDYTEALLFEGDFPCRFSPNLTVFVAPPLPEDQRLVEEIDDETQSSTSLDDLESGPERHILQLFEGRPEDAETAARRLEELAFQSATTSSKYRFTDGYGRIRSAKVVAINARTDDERERGDELADQIRELRRDDELYEELLSPGAYRRQIKIRVTDLSDRDDTGVSDLVRRIERELDRR